MVNMEPSESSLNICMTKTGYLFSIGNFKYTVAIWDGSFYVSLEANAKPRHLTCLRPS